MKHPALKLPDVFFGVLRDNSEYFLSLLLIVEFIFLQIGYFG